MKEFFPEGRLLLTKENEIFLSSEETLRRAMEEERVLEARVLKCDKDYRLHVDLGCMKGLIPRDEGAVGIADGSVREIALITRVGKPVQFTVTGFEESPEGGRIALLSRKRAQELCAENYVDRLVPGDVIDVTVSHMESFGAFCDVGAGVSALLPVDNISVSRISHPSDRFSEGQSILAVVRARDGLGRLTLTCKELFGTWEENAALIEAGETVTGIVRSVESYGVFVELFPNLAGLAERTEDYAVGETCVVFVKNVNPKRMKIKLAIVAHGGEAPVPEPRLFFEGSHMDRFVYSPAESERLVETVFG